MNEIITVNFDTQTVSARNLYAKLEVTDRFSRWFERMLAYGFSENEDFTSVKSSTVVNNGAERELQDYELSVDMAKHICMVQRTEKAKQVVEKLKEAIPKMSDFDKGYILGKVEGMAGQRKEKEEEKEKE